MYAWPPGVERVHSAPINRLLYSVHLEFFEKAYSNVFMQIPVILFRSFNVYKVGRI
jgi:hypothetical protein